MINIYYQMDNLDDFIKHYTTPIKSLQSEDKLMPVFPSMISVIGGTGSGKTNLVLNLLVSGKIKYSKIYLNALNVLESAYEAFIKHIVKIEQETDTEIITINNKLENIIPVDDLDENEQNVVIFDDFNIKRNQGVILEYYQRARKKNAMVFYLSQTWVDLPIYIRKQSHYFFIFKQQGDMSPMINFFSAYFDKNAFKEAYLYATKEKYNFLTIDLKTNDNNMMIRKNFNSGIVL